MEKEIKHTIAGLLNKTKVMTLAVSKNGMPWSSPVYFLFHDKEFYFFSNDISRHIQYAKDKKPVSASIFHESDRIDQIFGIQMSGTMEIVSKTTLYLLIVKKYIDKFNFLKKTFGLQIIENKDFFLEKFKSRLYCFHPDKIFLSDNSRTSNKRSEIKGYL